MYDVKFISNKGQITLGTNGIVADFDFGESVSVNIGTSQGFGQVGVTKETESVGERIINVKGVCYGDVPQKKKLMRKMFAPFTSGKLIMGDYEIQVTVKEPPAFPTVKNSGNFMMQLIAPYPFFRSSERKTVLLGEIKPMFKFPINYKTPHSFGEKSKGKTLQVYNDSDVSIPFSLDIVFYEESSMITISELKTFKKLKITGNYSAGDVIKLYRDFRQIMHCELIQGSKVTDILDRITDDSDLFKLEVGDNLFTATDNGNMNFTVYLGYQQEVVALYED